MFLFGWPLKSQVAEMAVELEAARADQVAARQEVEQAALAEDELKAQLHTTRERLSELGERYDAQAEQLKRGEAALVEAQDLLRKIRAYQGEDWWRVVVEWDKTK